MSALAHPLTWQAPRPLWRGTTPFAAAPQILRFASDDFMEQAIATLTHEPARISERIVKPETWRTPEAQTAIADMVPRVPLPAPTIDAKRKRFARSLPAAPPPDPSAPVKLYQPAHQRYYLVAGSLACALPGLPERTVAGGHETVHFVLRRLMPRDGAATGDQALTEFANVKEGDSARWQRLGAAETIAPGEEMLPLFPLTHADENGVARTLWTGLVPVARREEYLGQQVSRSEVTLAEGQLAALRPPAAPAPTPTKTARTALLRVEVSEPWKAMVRAAIKAGKELKEPQNDAPSGYTPNQRILDYNLQFQMQSWLLLVDLAQWLKDYLPRVHAALTSTSTTGLGTPEQAVLSWLEATNADALKPAMRLVPPADPNSDTIRPMAPSLRIALRDIGAAAAKLDAAAVQYGMKTLTAADWPSWHFPLAGLTLTSAADGPWTQMPAAAAGNDVDGPVEQIAKPISLADGATSDPTETIDRFTALLARALVADAEPTAPPVPHALKLRDLMIKTAGDPGVFVIRMVHVNADCGPLHPPTLSAPSARFRLASFFDPEAPVRPITITLPSDTSPAGLRKHGRGTAFVMSDMLCGQVQRAKGLGFVDLVRQVLPWPLHKHIDVGDGGGCKGGGTPGLEIGMICSLSIPIITLCALILLIIIVSLLDFIFRWMPWFIACFPVPKLKGKG